MKNGYMKIETGIPIPTAGGRSGASAILRELKKGQSTLLECSIQAAHSLIVQIGGRGKYTCRTVKDEGTRVWRIA